MSPPVTWLPTWRHGGDTVRGHREGPPEGVGGRRLWAPSPVPGDGRMAVVVSPHRVPSCPSVFPPPCPHVTRVPPPCPPVSPVSPCPCISTVPVSPDVPATPVSPSLCPSCPTMSPCHLPKSSSFPQCPVFIIHSHITVGKCILQTTGAGGNTNNSQLQDVSPIQ